MYVLFKSQDLLYRGTVFLIAALMSLSDAWALGDEVVWYEKKDAIFTTGVYTVPTAVELSGVVVDRDLQLHVADKGTNRVWSLNLPNGDVAGYIDLITSSPTKLHFRDPCYFDTEETSLLYSTHAAVGKISVVARLEGELRQVGEIAAPSAASHLASSTDCRYLFATYGNNLGVFEILSVNPFKYQQIADYSVASQLKGVSAAKDLGVLFPLFTAASGSSSLAYLTSDGPAGQLPIAPSAAWNVSFHEQTDDRLYVINKSSALNTSILREFDTAANPPSETGRQVTLPQCDAVALSLSFDDSAWIANEGRSGIYVSYELEATILPMGESRGAVDVAASKTVDVLRAYFTTGPKQLFACAVS